ncbi:MAG TPA: malto-oligosyltrehalose synthase [Candidatus Binataceae bacterium]|nr:malto-oligosyltrehalose synthase [Candidatus Binataceae bacterium]
MTETPAATYRVQLNAQFGFDSAAELAPYLQELGVDHLYSSPYLQAASGSSHGYDVVDHSRVNQELGGQVAYDRLCRELANHHLRQLIDIVPNHMAITGRENPWWWDVLQNGPSSPYASYFDVDWEPPERRLHNMVLMPVLEDQYGVLLRDGKIKLAREGAEFIVAVGDRAFPVVAGSLRLMLAVAAQIHQNDMLTYLADAFGRSPSPASADRIEIARFSRERRLLGSLLARLIDEDPASANAIDRAIDQINEDRTLLHQLLEAQNYRLAHWRMAARDLGYRRFFDITTLVGLRMENVEVFEKTHSLILQWVGEGRVSGLRVDHPDGLRDPQGYFQRLRAACPNAWIVAEKILSDGERLRESWPIDGTTGYDFLNVVGRLLMDSSGREPLTEFYREFTGEKHDYSSLVRARKQFAMRGSLGSDINRLTAQFLDVCESDVMHRDYSRHEVHEVLRAALACLNIYRTYARETGEISAEDVRHIDAAIAEAKAYRGDLDPRLFDFLGDVLKLRVEKRTAVELATRFQQVSAAVMAKGLEDTVFYNYNRMIALNEVGGDPATFSAPPRSFYRWCRETQKKWPRTMLATSTHDTKRSEDVRARLFVLSEIPVMWADVVRRWSTMNRERRESGTDLLDRNFEYHLYQALVGAWPIQKERLWQYAEKAMREGKVYTSWTDPNRDYEQSVRHFIDGLYDNSQFIRSLDDFVSGIIEPGRVNSLVQTLIKLTAPGVPDFYQGCELWDLSLVDPDNRRAVDFARRRLLLRQLLNASAEQVMERAADGSPKLWLIHKALKLRQSHPEWFGKEADITPLRVAGRKSDHVIAYSRGDSVLAIAPRLTVKLGGDWRDTTVELPAGEWFDSLGGGRIEGGTVRIEGLLRRFPVALLSREGGAR